MEAQDYSNKNEPDIGIHVRLIFYKYFSSSPSK
ncbi:hypothetical protein SAMN04488695_11442 [Proteiniclasticum ruminis]|uniref:Uncharacterized protein n=1 Tax=Proteiniclasticum ruminis TaxID=398199 RepID=A0A1I5E7P3_9CLOT|nr:hypothetical protein SAMN04488695_11442 [Proteiniclasticum ruminis]